MSRDEFNPSTLEETSDFVQESVSNIKEHASGLASKVRDKASQAGNAVSETVVRQREKAASGLHRVASTIHENATSIPGGPKAAKVAHTIADGMESTASYLRERDFKNMGDDLIAVCRRHPAQAMLSALAIRPYLGSRNSIPKRNAEAQCPGRSSCIPFRRNYCWPQAGTTS